MSPPLRTSRRAPRADKPSRGRGWLRSRAAARRRGRSQPADRRSSSLLHDEDREFLDLEFLLERARAAERLAILVSRRPRLRWMEDHRDALGSQDLRPKRG